MPTSKQLGAYCQGFVQAFEPWPVLPLADAPELAWWQALLGGQGQVQQGQVHQGHVQQDLFQQGHIQQGQVVVNALTAALPQLRLPQVHGISSSDLYRAVVLRGNDPGSPELLGAARQIGTTPQWQQPEALQLWIAPHPCGAMPVLQTPSWADFALLVRALAHRGEPVELADGVHAQAISGLIHWGLIQQFGRDSRARLIVLHQAPYGSVTAEQVPGGLSDGAWLAASTSLRLEHELTHLATKRLLGEMRLNLLDELIADCMGMVAALGRFDAGLFGRCLGIAVSHGDLPIANGRWLSYTGELTEVDARNAVVLVMERARELETALQRHPVFLQPAEAMARLQWLCQQRLDQPISAPLAGV